MIDSFQIRGSNYINYYQYCISFVMGQSEIVSKLGIEIGKC